MQCRRGGGLILFGLEVMETATGFSKILLNPGALRIPAMGTFSVQGFILAKDEVFETVYFVMCLLSHLS